MLQRASTAERATALLHATGSGSGSGRGMLHATDSKRHAVAGLTGVCQYTRLPPTRWRVARWSCLPHAACLQHVACLAESRRSIRHLNDAAAIGST